MHDAEDYACGDQDEFGGARRGARVTTEPAIQTVATLSTAWQLIAPIRAGRAFLSIENIGASDIAVGFSSTWSGAAGTVLSPGGLGAQGGFFVWESGYIPCNPIYAVLLSSAGSAVSIIECITT